MTKILKVFAFVLLLSTLLMAQEDKGRQFVKTQVKVTANNLSRDVMALSRDYITYISANDFAKHFKVGIFVNPETEKVELKFADHNLKITARNPFWVLTDRKSNSVKNYQIPLSSVIVGGDIYFPIDYSVDIFRTCFNGAFLIDLKTKPKETKKEAVITEIEAKKDEGQPPKSELEPTGTIGENKDVKSEVKVTPKLILAIEERVNGTLIRFRSVKKHGKYNYSLKNDVINVSLNIPDLTVESIEHNGPLGLVKGIEVTRVQNRANVLISLEKNYSNVEVINVKEDILITVHSKKFIEDIRTKDQRKKWSFNVVVLDPGHGGKDPGAIGISGAKEKDINLAIAKRVREILKSEMSNLRVEMTREGDSFVELYKRGKIANEKNGNLFISIHCNAAPKKNSAANGFEVYLLRPGRTDEAIAIAEFENSVIKYEDDASKYQKLTDENFILVTMAHSAYMRFSEKFAEMLDGEVRRNADISSKGVKQAGFYVLVGASMPSVLVEAGFLSNAKDEAYLKSKKGQDQIARAIVNSIKSFRKFYEDTIKSEN